MTLQSKEFIKNCTRSQTGKMAAVDETFSTLVRNIPSNKAHSSFHWLPSIM